MPLRLPTFCPFLYPPRRTSPWPLLRLLNLQWSQSRSYASKQAKTHIRNDMGLLPGTFVMPSRKPSLFRTPKLRMRVEWYRLKKRLRALHGRVIYKYFLKGRPWPNLRRRTIASEAQKLYKKMYTAFADGDIATLKSVCHEGLLASFRTRINVRPSKESLQWTLHEYIGSPRIVSTNIAMLEIEKSALYQVVVRIKSIQSLKKTPANGLANDRTEERKMVEHVVLQRKMWRGVEDGWKIWGTIEESKVEDVLGDDGVVATPAVGKP